MCAAKPDAEELLLRVLQRRDPASLTHVERVPARPAVTAAWPEWAPAQLRSAWAARGITTPWHHQIQAATAAYTGEHVMLATGTASGKSLAYQLPVLSRLLSDARATALYLCPTKALAADQLRSVLELDLPDIRPSGYDGDTPHDEREWIRAHARLVFTNPDMLHRSILPRHSQWSGFLRRLCFVVVDECHTYRGVFGSHVAQVLRRLRRVLRTYATRTPVLAPVFILASATAGDPATAAVRLTGLPVRALTEDGRWRLSTSFSAPFTGEESGVTADAGGPARADALAVPVSPANPTGATSTVTVMSKPCSRQATRSARFAAATTPALRQAALSPSTACRAPANAARSAAAWAWWRATMAAPTATEARATSMVSRPAPNTHTVAPPRSDVCWGVMSGRPGLAGPGRGRGDVEPGQVSTEEVDVRGDGGADGVTVHTHDDDGTRGRRVAPGLLAGPSPRRSPHRLARCIDAFQFGAYRPHCGESREQQEHQRRQ